MTNLPYAQDRSGARTDRDTCLGDPGPRCLAEPAKSLKLAVASGSWQARQQAAVQVPLTGPACPAG